MTSHEPTWKLDGTHCECDMISRYGNCKLKFSASGSTRKAHGEGATDAILRRMRTGAYNVCACTCDVIGLTGPHWVLTTFFADK